MAEWQFSHTQVIQITIQPFGHKNTNIFYFEMSGQITIWPFSIKKAWKFLSSQMAIQTYTCHSVVHPQTQTQKESEAFKTHVHHVLFSVDRSFKASWGSFLILRAELEGFEELVRMGVWDFSFIISASDLPLRSVDDMAAMLAPYRGGCRLRMERVWINIAV